MTKLTLSLYVTIANEELGVVGADQSTLAIDAKDLLALLPAIGSDQLVTKIANGAVAALSKSIHVAAQDDDFQDESGRLLALIKEIEEGY